MTRDPQPLTNISLTATKLIETLKGQISGINADNLLAVVALAMEIVDKFRLDGAGKKIVVIEALEHMVDETVMDVPFAQLIKIILPSSIDTIIDLTQHQFDINVTSNSLLCCWC